MSQVQYAGYRGHGQDGSGRPRSALLEFTVAPGLGSPDEIWAGYNTVWTQKDDGEPESVGGGTMGQLQDETYQSEKLKLGPTVLPHCLHVALREGHDVALTTKGVATGGGNLYGTRGDGTSDFGKEELGRWVYAEPYFPHIPLSAGDEIIAVAAGDLCSGALTRFGHVWVWGWNRQGVVGDGTTFERLVPTRAMVDTTSKRVTAFVLGYQHALAMYDDGDIQGWGNNTGGQLGTGDRTSRHVPATLKVPTSAEPIAIAAGGNRSYVLDADGNLYLAGEGYPSWRISAKGVKWIEAGDTHDLLIEDELSEVCARGNNAFGGLSDGTREAKHNWVHTGVMGATQVRCGFQFSLALTQ